MQVQREAKTVHYQNTGKKAIKITFPFNYDDLSRVKSLPGRKYHSERKFWTCPLSIEAIEKLINWNFTVEQQLRDYLKQNKINVKEVKPIDVPGLKGTLLPYQKQGAGFTEAKDGRALIADEMGLGKTLQALAYLQLHKEKRPAIVVVPASLKYNWVNECNKWLPDPNTQILSRTKPDSSIIGDIIIINYDILPFWIDVLKGIKPQVLIIDEIHYTKNSKAKRSKAVKILARQCPHVIGLSGTPVINRPIEAYNALKMIDGSVVPDFWQYAKKYCGATHNGFGWDFTGATNTEELHKKLINSVMIRRKKADVLKDLPDKIYSHIPIKIDNEKEYQRAEEDFEQFVKHNFEKDLLIKLRETLGQELAESVEFKDHKLERLKEEKASKVNVLTEIEGLKQLAVKGKLKQSIDWIKDFLEVDGKLVVFCTHKFVIDELMKEFSDVAVKVDGSVTGEQRQKAVDAFQGKREVERRLANHRVEIKYEDIPEEEQPKLFIGNIKAAGVGITLTAASNVAFLELPWTPGDLQQAEDRCHRIGQRDSVNVYYLLAMNTIEEKIARLLDKKRKVVDSVLDGTKTAEESLITNLLKEYQ